MARSLRCMFSPQGWPHKSVENEVAHVAPDSFQYKRRSFSSWVNGMRDLFLELPEDDGLLRIKEL